VFGLLHCYPNVRVVKINFRYEVFEITELILEEKHLFTNLQCGIEQTMTHMSDMTCDKISLAVANI
jgi:hypothetical protein